MNWNLNIWSPTGIGPRVVQRDDTWIEMSGIRATLSPSGDTQEMTFNAAGAGLRLENQDLVQVVAEGVAIAYGILTIGGNVQDLDGHTHTFRSARTLFQGALLSGGFRTPAQPAHLTIRAIVQDVMAQGYLGGGALVRYDPARIPDLGYDCVAIDESNYQDAHAFLADITAQAPEGYTVDWGVGPDRTFFCEPVRSSVLDLSLDDVRTEIRAEVPVGEPGGVITGIQWLVARRTDRSWLAHLSRSLLADRYGLRAVPYTIAEDYPGLWQPVPLMYTVDSESTFVAYTGQKVDGRDIYSKTDPQAAAPLLANGELGTALTVKRAHERVPSQTDPNTFDTVYNTATGDVVVTASGTGLNRVRVAVWGYWQREVPSPTRPGWYTLEEQPLSVEITVGGETVKYRTSVAESSSMQTLVLGGESVTLRVPLSTKPGEEWELWLFVQELAAERLNRDLLDNLAQQYYQTPDSEPLTIPLAYFVPPAQHAGRVTITERGYQAQVTAWEWELSAEVGLVSNCKTGKKDRAEALALAQRVQARDTESVVRAVQAAR